MKQGMKYITGKLSYLQKQPLRSSILNTKPNCNSREIICTPMIIEALFTMPKIWNQPNAPQWMDKENVLCILIQWNVIQS